MLLGDLQDHAGVAAALGLIAAAAWKIYLRLKSDSRNDKTDARKSESEVDQYDHYDSLIENLRGEVDRLAGSVGRLSRELDEERRARFAAEDLANSLKLKVEYLEFEVKRLTGARGD